MSNSKTGQAQIAAMYVSCPECSESFDGTEDGSQLVSMHNFKLAQMRQPVTCNACGTEYRLPASLRKVFVP